MYEEPEIVNCVVLRETDLAFLLSDRDNPDTEAYFPKSQISFKQRNLKTGMAVVEIPAWLLKAKGWS